MSKQNNSMFKYSLEEIIEAEENHVVHHMFYYKPFQNAANKQNGKIWVNYARLANAYDKLKERYPSAFKLYDS